MTRASKKKGGRYSRATKTVPCPKCKGTGTRHIEGKSFDGHTFEYNAFCGTCLGTKTILEVAHKEIKQAQKNQPPSTRKVCTGCKREIDSYWSQTDKVRKYCFHDDNNGIKCSKSGKPFTRSKS